MPIIERSSPVAVVIAVAGSPLPAAA